jgi:hypothetical protein
MIPEEALQLVLGRLDDCGIAYMITGSFASNMQGVPRATQDADVIIESSRKSLDKFIASLGADFYASPEAAKEALQIEGIFNVIHLETGFKIDLIIRKSRPFSQTEFSRRQKVTFLGQSRWFATAEDIILAKLEWAKSGSSERQFTDALNVAKVRRSDLNWPYIQKWADDLGVSELLGRLRSELDKEKKE